jgi:YfiR/HmsC-like
VIAVNTPNALHSDSVHPVSIRYAAVALLLFTLAAHGEQVPEYELKAEFLSRFTNFIDWPPSSDGRPFTIGVIGRNPFNGYLGKLAARRIKNRPVSIRYITELPQIDGCDIVFICGSEKQRLAAILARTDSRPILTVADSGGFAEAGVLINFYSTADTVRFEINESAVDRSGLKVSSKLFKLAKVVEARP